MHRELSAASAEELVSKIRNATVDLSTKKKKLGSDSVRCGRVSNSRIMITAASREEAWRHSGNIRTAIRLLDLRVGGRAVTCRVDDPSKNEHRALMAKTMSVCESQCPNPAERWVFPDWPDRVSLRSYGPAPPPQDGGEAQAAMRSVLSTLVAVVKQGPSMRVEWQREGFEALGIVLSTADLDAKLASI